MRCMNELNDIIKALFRDKLQYWMLSSFICTWLVTKVVSSNPLREFGHFKKV